MADKQPAKGQEKRDASMAKAAAKMSDADLAEKAKAIRDIPEKKRTAGEKAAFKAIANEIDKRAPKRPARDPA